MTLRNTKARVLVQGKVTDYFEIVSGVKQGDSLSSIMFNLMLHSILKEIAQGAIIPTKSVQISAYADDVAIIARNVDELRDVFQRMVRIADEIGLKVNADKTKYLAKIRYGKLKDLVIREYHFEAVPRFTYLGVVFSSSTDAAVAVQERIKIASRCYYAYEKLLKSKLLPKPVKIKIYKTLIRPVLTYGCET